jgi:epoxyqueuosine reductase
MTPLSAPATLKAYIDWINKGYAAGMDYLAEQLKEKAEPQSFLPQARSSIVVAIPYLDHEKQERLSQLPVAIYAQGRDYHNWVRRRLEAVVHDLQPHFPEEEFLCFADSAPIMERDLAHRSGIGWVGKNTCLINEKIGSLFFIGEIHTTLLLESPVSVAVDRCGTCTKCIDICPTEALVEPRVLDARKCLSYWTIESRDEPPISIREKSSWYFGCDLCQTICPWNSKPLQIASQASQDMQWGVPGRLSMEENINENRDLIVSELRALLGATNSQIQMRFQGTAMSRAKAHHHRNNAIILCAHYNLTELIEEVKALLYKPRHRELAEWALIKLGVRVSPAEVYGFSEGLQEPLGSQTLTNLRESFGNSQQGHFRSEDRLKEYQPQPLE